MPLPGSLCSDARRAKKVPAMEVVGWRDTVALVKTLPFRYVPGLQMEVLLRYEKKVLC